MHALPGLNPDQCMKLYNVAFYILSVVFCKMLGNSANKIGSI